MYFPSTRKTDAYIAFKDTSPVEKANEFLKITSLLNNQIFFFSNSDVGNCIKAIFETRLILKTAHASVQAED